ncbi:hypothetical protein PisoF_02954 [Pseudomonas sp. IsoF]|jgi:hypothetical protein|nr:hypothetical protein PisoF_02954 [Pseudomonas sp. IsoF]
MRVLDLNLSNTKPFEASRFLDNAQVFAAFLTEGVWTLRRIQAGQRRAIAIASTINRDA